MSSAPLLYSVIIPVYNRPDEVQDLLHSLTKQQYGHFEVLIIEDGSEDRCQKVAESFQNQLDIRYFYKENSGQGFSRNFGFKRARGDYYVVFDSDCIIPPHYFTEVNNQLQQHWVDAYGGPDRAHESFTTMQKAISYAMTSPLTTGGIRGNAAHAGTFTPRSFNMGISPAAFKKTGGYRITRMGEDIEFSLRIARSGFSTALFTDAYVYHKRRTSLADFYRQLHFFGRARINISRFYPEQIELIHWLPALLVIFTVLVVIGGLFVPPLMLTFLLLAIVGYGTLSAHAFYSTKNSSVALLSGITAGIQLYAYGIGFLSEYVKPREQ